MSIEKMSLVQINGKTEALDEVLFRCSIAGSFHPEEASVFSEKVGGFSPLSEENPYTSLLNKVTDIGAVAGVNFSGDQVQEKLSRQYAEQLFIKNIKKLVVKAVLKNSPIKAGLEKLHTRISSMKPAQIKSFSVGDFLAAQAVLIKFGRVSIKDISLLPNLSDVVFEEVHKDKEYCWGAFLAPPAMQTQLEEAMDAAGFEDMWLPQLGLSSTQLSMTRTEGYLEQLHQKLMKLNAEKLQNEAEVEQEQNALKQLEHIKGLDVSFDDIFSCKYLTVRFGRLPHDSYAKLNYYGERMFVFASFDQDAGYHWGVYFTTPQHEVEIDDIFSSLYFERIWIPEFAHGTPEMAEQAIREQLQESQKLASAATKELTHLVQENSDIFIDIYLRVQFLSSSFDMRRYVSVYANQFHMTGFVPKSKEKQFQTSLDGVDGVTLELKPQDSDKRLKTPTKLKNSRFAQPFEMFVDMYGLPAYEDMDPTPVVAITYTLLFGIMFGDLGQGVLLSLLGLLLWKTKKLVLGRIMIRLGCASAFFGFFYGSVFGFEELLNPFFKETLGIQWLPIHVMSPSITNTLLMAAIGIGVTLILTSMLLNIYIGLKRKNYEQALFSNNGIAGFVFYASVVAAAALTLLTDTAVLTPLYIGGLIALPLVCIFLKHPLGKLVAGKKDLMPEEGIGGFLTEGFFEMFEVLLSFVSNTMSFLRVGGFILSHAGMMAVVMTLSSMMKGSGSIIVIIIGNLFVMGLEGFIVGIQVLRLEFYEMFSRYFDGDGKPYAPITIGSVEQK